MVKRITRISWVRRVLCGLGYIYIHLVYVTSRWQHENTEHAEALWRRDQPFIIAFWHGRLMMMPFIWRRGVPINMLISQHADGELVTLTMQNFGVGNVRGSSKRGGAAALRELVRLIERGENVGFTPDGPRGPRMRAAEGVVAVARLSGVPVLPASVATTRCRILNSWDRFQVALPFGRGIFLWGQPIHVPREARGPALEAARLAVETALNDLTLEADRRSGVGPVTPADPEPAAGAAERAPAPAQPAQQSP